MVTLIWNWIKSLYNRQKTIDCYMIYIHRVTQDQNGLCWPRGFYLPVPKDPKQRPIDYNTIPEVQRYLKNHNLP